MNLKVCPNYLLTLTARHRRAPLLSTVRRHDRRRALQVSSSDISPGGFAPSQIQVTRSPRCVLFLPSCSHTLPSSRPISSTPPTTLTMPTNFFTVLLHPIKRRISLPRDLGLLAIKGRHPAKAEAELRRRQEQERWREEEAGRRQLLLEAQCRVLRACVWIRTCLLIVGAS